MASPVTPGQVILLNGASSSGKTSIAAELQEVMDRPWFHLPVDAFSSMRGRRQTAVLDEPALAAVLARTRAIRDYVARGPAPRAFARLRAGLAHPSGPGQDGRPAPPRRR